MITIETFVIAVDILLISTVILYSKRKTNIVKRGPCQKWVVPVSQKLSHETKNRYLARWKHLNLNQERLPLNRIAFLKARYNIGPFQNYKQFSEVSLSFLKCQAQHIDLPKLEYDERHPKCYMTEFTETYVQYRALLYDKQGMSNVDAKHQYTFSRQEQNETKSRKASVSIPIYQFSFSSTTISEEIQQMLRQNSPSSSEETKDWAEFEREKERTQNKLREVKDVLQLMKTAN